MKNPSQVIQKPTLKMLVDENYIYGLPIWSQTEVDLEGICALLGISETDKEEPTQEELAEFILIKTRLIVKAVNAYDKNQETIKELRDNLQKCLEFFENPELSTWPYVENGDMYKDISDLLPLIKQALKNSESED